MSGGGGHPPGPPATTGSDPGLSRAGRGFGGLADKGFKYLALGAGITVLAVLALIAISTTHEAWPIFRHEGFRFFTSDSWIPNDPDGTGPLGPHFGALAFVYGTLVVSTIALVVAVPVSIAIGLFVTEVAPGRLRGPVVTVLDLLAAIPSVVYGLWGVLVLVPAVPGFYQHLHDWLGWIPLVGKLFGPGPLGRSFFTAGLILAVMIIPIITSVTREVLATVPRGEKDAALALGATRWEMIKGAVLPHSFGGIVGAVMLGLGRAMGETIAVALTIGATPQIVANLFRGGDAMPAVIANQFGQAEEGFRAALIGLGVALFVLTIVVSVSARAVVARAEVRMRGA